jgi:hypothetical protein
MPCAPRATTSWRYIRSRTGPPHLGVRVFRRRRRLVALRDGVGQVAFGDSLHAAVLARDRDLTRRRADQYRRRGGRRGRSLDGDFTAGDVVALTATDGRVFARGLVNYPADDLRRIAGLRTERIAEVLGEIPYEEVVHRDNLAVIDRSESPDRPCSRNS